jgi:hypothetical protein
MEAVIFTGIQASGKTTFYLQHFFRTHLHISLDVLKTRRREQAVLLACLQVGQRFVVDNTSVTAAERALCRTLKERKHPRKRAEGNGKTPATTCVCRRLRRALCRYNGGKPGVYRKGSRG